MYTLFFIIIIILFYFKDITLLLFPGLVLLCVYLHKSPCCCYEPRRYISTCLSSIICYSSSLSIILTYYNIDACCCCCCAQHMPPPTPSIQIKEFTYSFSQHISKKAQKEINKPYVGYIRKEFRNDWSSLSAGLWYTHKLFFPFDSQTRKILDLAQVYIYESRGRRRPRLDLFAISSLFDAPRGPSMIFVRYFLSILFLNQRINNFLGLVLLLRGLWYNIGQRLALFSFFFIFYFLVIDRCVFSPPLFFLFEKKKAARQQKSS